MTKLPDSSPDQPADPQARRTELEIRVTELDDAVEALHRTVYRQQQQIDRLAQAVVALRAQVQAAQAPGSGDAREELPPHY